MTRQTIWHGGADARIEVSEYRGVRLLHIGGQAVQSAMRLSAPEELELHYTRAMMSFLLFHPRPADIVMVGLGGGSLARFIHARLASACLKVIEISSDVVDAARRYFGLPPEDERLELVIEDAGNWLPRHPAAADVLLLDAFEDGRQVSALCSETFYSAAWAALKPGGVLVANFIADDRQLGTWQGRIEARFGGRTLLLPARDDVNLIVLAFRDGPDRIPWEELRARAEALKSLYPLPVDWFLSALKARNSHTLGYLEIVPD